MNETVKVSHAGRCPLCGSERDSNAPQGLCPRCLLEGATAPTEPDPDRAQHHAPPPIEAVRAAFPQLEVLEVIGAGGMGTVYRARQPKLDRMVALKLLAEPLGRNPAFAERFQREARVLAKLNHPNIVSVFDFGEAGGFYYLLMEFVDGVNLRQAMRAGKFTPTQALEVVPRICEALQFAHEHGILHRDIKPENILLDSKGRVKIADFGIAKLMGTGGSEVTLTASGAVLGTLAYMAPEQIEKPGEVDHRADIYSLGVVFYEMLTGELPLGRFAPPSQKTPVDERVDAIVLRALAKERELRQQSAGEVKTQVEDVAFPPLPAQSETRPAVAPVPPPDDFFLCNPRLPRMGQAITVYGLLVAPFFWALGVGLLDFNHLAQHPGAAFLDGMWQFFGDLLGGLATTVVLLVGALKLRTLQASGPGWLRCGIWLRLGLGALGLLVLIWTGILDWDSPINETETRVPLGEIIVLAVMVVAAGFEIAMLVWLRRNRGALASLCRQLPAPRATSGPASDARLAPRTSKKAMLSALLAVPLWLQAARATVVGLLSLFHRDAALSAAINSGSPGLAAVSFAGFAGLLGLLLGVLALSDIRRNQGRLRGAGLALMGILGAPFALAVTLTPALVLTLGASGYLPASVGRRFYEVAPVWLAGVLVVAVARLKRWAEIPSALGSEATGSRGLVVGVAATVLLLLLPLAALVLTPLRTNQVLRQANPTSGPHPPPGLSTGGPNGATSPGGVAGPPAIPTNTVPASGFVRIDLGVPRGQGVLIEMLTATREGVSALPGSAGYLLASAERDATAVFLWGPNQAIPARDPGMVPWQLAFHGEQGVRLAATTNLSVPEAIARLVPGGGATMVLNWLEPDRESAHWILERTGSDRPGLGVRLRTFAHGLGVVELKAQGFAGTGTNWTAEFPPAIRTAPPL